MRSLFSIAAVALITTWSSVRAEDLNDATEKAVKSAAAKASPWVVKIETAGGRDVIGGPPAGGPPAGGRPPARGGAPGVRKGVGPTSGIIVASDGYVISSAFNFANKPTDIFVTVPGRERKVAKIIANDTSRMLTLLKVDFTDLPVPVAMPKKEIEVGQWSLALGRGGFSDDAARTASVSTGIVSALGRIWGKAIQTDAKVSPVNYGGPLVSIDGRAMGVLVPASPQGDGDTAGVEWYDSGIGFAIPFEDVLAAYPRLKGGKDLRRGFLGFTAQNSGEQYNVPVVVGNIAPESAAQKAGLKVGDKIIELDGKPVANFSQLQHLLGPKYEGDTVSVKVEREGKVETFAKVELGGNSATVAQPFLGILPMRDDPDAGVEIRFVYPKSPAELAGLKEGDRIMKVGAAAPGAPVPPPMPPKQPMPPRPAPPAGTMAPITGGKAQFAQLISRIPVGTEVQLEVKRASVKDKDGKVTAEGKIETVKAKLVAVPEGLPEKIPYPSSKERAGEKAKPIAGLPGVDEPKEDDGKEDEDDKLEKGYVDRENKVLAREYWMYIPDNYKKKRSYGVIIWLHDDNKAGKDGKDMKRMWENYCDQANYIMIGPKSKKGSWVATEAEEVVRTINDALTPYTIDRNRVIAHGIGGGGSMALYLGFNARDLVRGVAVSGAMLPNNPKDNLPNQPLAFFLVAGDKDPILKGIQDTKVKLEEKKFPVVYREIKDFGKEYLDQTTLNELVVWIDTLDRI